MSSPVLTCVGRLTCVVPVKSESEDHKQVPGECPLAGTDLGRDS